MSATRLVRAVLSAVACVPSLLVGSLVAWAVM
jgi:hypothetical protein